MPFSRAAGCSRGQHGARDPLGSCGPQRILVLWWPSGQERGKGRGRRESSLPGGPVSSLSSPLPTGGLELDVSICVSFVFFLCGEARVYVQTAALLRWGGVLGAHSLHSLHSSAPHHLRQGDTLSRKCVWLCRHSFSIGPVTPPPGTFPLDGCP